ncbi:MAG TPA: hypothetical protein PK759_04145, partial [Spirochaetales bacterium]|nr:hypothetical protein [Spirochaetales bacterium]HPS14972.1 hypothetical protein [Spirochaetales bacterium]
KIESDKESVRDGVHRHLLCAPTPAAARVFVEPIGYCVGRSGPPRCLVWNIPRTVSRATLRIMGYW